MSPSTWSWTAQAFPYTAKGRGPDTNLGIRGDEAGANCILLLMLMEPWLPHPYPKRPHGMQAESRTSSTITQVHWLRSLETEAMTRLLCTGKHYKETPTPPSSSTPESTGSIHIGDWSWSNVMSTSKTYVRTASTTGDGSQATTGRARLRMPSIDTRQSLGGS